MIEIQMSKSVRQEFLLAIDFLNNKRQCQLIFSCQTVQPQLTYQTRTSDRKQIIEIAQLAQMKNIWNKDRQVLLIIEQEIIFINASQAVATVNYQSIVSANDPIRILYTVEFHSPILQIISDTLIDVGLIESGRVWKKNNVLIMKNLGQKSFIKLILQSTKIGQIEN